MKVLLVGETWITQSTHIKGVDSFSTATLESGADEFIAALAADPEIEVTHLMGHDVPMRFPETQTELAQFDVILLSDIGSRSFLLHPDTWTRGRAKPDRLEVLRDWVSAGGGLGMVGGYLSFQGLDGAAKYKGTPIEEILPVKLKEWDDCVEVPSGGKATVVADHEIVSGVPADWPLLLGYNKLTSRDDATVPCLIEGDPLLACRTVGQGRTLAWASDIGPHWCPLEFLEWEGFGQLWRNAIRWLAQSGE